MEHHFHLSAILKNLPQDHPWGSRIHFYDCVESTNTLAKTMAAGGAPHGTVLIADRQTLGRGRLGRSFLSPGGAGIYLSVILRPDCLPRELMHLTCAAAAAMCDAVEKATGLRPGIKWTNDLVHGKRKLAGILTELGLDSSTGKISYAVVGIGINCCQKEGDFPPELQNIAASLAMVTGNEIDRSALAAAMIDALEGMDRQLLAKKATILNAYRANCVTLGQEVSVVRGAEIRHGTALDIDEDGALVVRFTDGRTEAVSSGEVSIRGMYGYV